MSDGKQMLQRIHHHLTRECMSMAMRPVNTQAEYDYWQSLFQASETVTRLIGDDKEDQ